MQKLIFTIGVSASGKTTWARRYCIQNPDFIRINRDDLRGSLFGYNLQGYFDEFNTHGKDESLITKLTLKMIDEALEKGRSVILDNTHLKYEYISDVIKKLRYTNYAVELQMFPENLETCIRRDAAREISVGESVIKRQFQQFKYIDQLDWFTRIREYKESLTFTPVVQNFDLPKAVIFDIDGTLAKHNGRSPYDYSKVSTDITNSAVYNLYEFINMGNYDPLGNIGRYTQKEWKINIIICTGREGTKQCKNDTLKWLQQNGIDYDEFYIRNEGDSRKDSIIKREFLEDIITKYNVLFAVDDRTQVIDMWRASGIPAFQVDKGDF